MKCLSCSYEDTNYSVFNFMIFPLEKIYNSLKGDTKSNNYINNNKFGYKRNNSSNQRKLTLDDCFQDFEKEENFFGNNQIHCNQCNRDSNAIMGNKIYQAPNVLILIINRGKGNYFKCDLEFPHQLNIGRYILKYNSPKIYNLIGVISHLGESSMEGHFIAYCKHFDDNWYLFNDGIVKGVSQNDIYKGTPYILFYQNKDIN